MGQGAKKVWYTTDATVDKLWSWTKQTLRATPKDYILPDEILMEKYPLTISLSGYFFMKQEGCKPPTELY